MSRLPLEGYRVTDFGWVWAGTVLGSIFADMGAEVIKVESVHRLDGLRLGKVFELGEALEVNPNFHNLNHSKMSITLDLRSPEGPRFAKELIKVSDIVVENFTPRFMPEVGLTYEELKKVKPDLVMISLPPAGSSGPLSDLLAYAPILSALSGLDSMVGYPGERVLGIKHAYTDPTASLIGAYAVLAALRHRNATGEGQHIELPQWEASISLVGEAVMDYSMNKRVAGTTGNLHPMMAPHNCYRSEGDDQWISIAIKTDDEWQAFCNAIGNPAWTREERFADRYQRQKNVKELDKLVTEWTSQHSKEEAADILQAAGVAAAPVLDTEGLFFSEHFKERGDYVDIDHPVGGNEVIYATPFRLSETPGHVWRSSPLLGQDNDYIFGEVETFVYNEIAKYKEEKIIH
ncbi:MAG: CoA transferase [Chloroflexi bacterium]|nr:CoA transferase [Chloroflexota bacterium]